MNLYRRLGDQVGTLEARDLATQLAAWHDAMVKHQRVLEVRGRTACDDGCPHEEAVVLWSAAQETFGARAADLAFLRSHGDDDPRPPRRPQAHSRVEMRA